MKATYGLLRACFQAGVKLHQPLNVYSRRVACKCSTYLRFSSNDASKVTSDEQYFKDLANSLHPVAPDKHLGPMEPTIKPNIEITKNYDKINQPEAVEFEEEEFDSLAEKPVAFDDVPKVVTVSFNLAAYVNKSETLQQLVKLGVDLSKWDAMKDVPSKALKLDYEKDIQKYIMFLHDAGVPSNELGNFLTKNPMILFQRIDDLQVRLNYLESKKFSAEAIGRIITKAPHFLLFSTEKIDRRLGYFQQEFHLSGDEVRSVITMSPKLTVWNFIKLKQKQFSLKEEMGFNSEEVKTLLLNKPKLWLVEHRSLLERFDYVHNIMKIPHNQIVGFPTCLTYRRFQIKQRHLFLVALNRAQYDPTQPLYVSLQAICSGNDFQFCTTVAKSSIKKYNEFLKTF